MSESKKSSGLKKWLTIFGFLVLVAVVVVGILLFIPANSSNMLNTIEKAQEIQFLIDGKEKNAYASMQTTISANEQTSQYATEIADVVVLANALVNVLDYYDDYMALANENDVYSQNYKDIKNSLNSAVELQGELSNILNSFSEETGSGTTGLRNFWIKFRNTFYSWLDNYKVAIVALNNIYQGSFEQSTTNNLASTIILNAVDDYVNVITSDFKILVLTDLQTSQISSYKYNTHGKIACFKKFVDRSLTNNSDIKNYVFSNVIQNKYNNINQFFTLYKDSNFFAVLNSIRSDGTITKTYYDVTDSNNVYNAVKVFLS